tara:strand:- start:3897 stop:4646 length:750 start_codon:yes stop_codon:yes gene_type:complete
MGGRLDISIPDDNNKIAIVLVDPKYDGNIGAVARAILNFGMNDLRIVGRQGKWSEEVRNRAKHAQEILDSCQLHDSIKEAVRDCSVVVGTSGKREIGEKITFRHFVTPEELPDRLEGVDGKVAFVFGPEDIGLTNEQLHECDLLMTIPSWEGYPILNLSHAVSIVCYSWYSLISNDKPTENQGRLLDPELRRILRSEISRLVENLPTKEHKKHGIEETLIRVIMRGLPKDDEIHRLIGVISLAADSLED